MDTLVIGPGTPGDIDALARLYDDVNDHLAGKTDGPGWIKGVYPTREIAQDGVAQGTLFVARHGNRLAGTVVLNHRQEPGYEAARWLTDADSGALLVIHTLAVHPDYRKAGVGRRLMDFAEAYAVRRGMRALRLDVNEGNLPAIRLYERCGYLYTGAVDLGLGQYGLDRFRAYEKPLAPAAAPE